MHVEPAGLFRLSKIKTCLASCFLEKKKLGGRGTFLKEKKNRKKKRKKLL